MPLLYFGLTDFAYLRLVWGSCNLTSFSPCLTGPADYPFASRHKGPRFKFPGGYLCENGILLLALSRYTRVLCLNWTRNLSPWATVEYWIPRQFCGSGLKEAKTHRAQNAMTTSIGWSNNTSFRFHSPGFQNRNHFPNDGTPESLRSQSDHVLIHSIHSPRHSPSPHHPPRGQGRERERGEKAGQEKFIISRSENEFFGQ